VIANRIWQWHFGRGLAPTTDNVGIQSPAPEHLQLLDWLAADFIRHGWSLKRLHRLILTSQTYRRSSTIDPNQPEHRTAVRVDPGSRLLWRFALRRLDAEAIRDRLLFSSGELNATVGGREMYPELSGEVLAGQSRPGLGWEPSPPDQQARRSLYAVVKRSVGDPLTEVFDYSNKTSPLTERPVTTVAPQALLLLHGRFTAQRADHLATQVAADSRDQTEQVQKLYRAVLQRMPTERELALACETLAGFESDRMATSGRISFRPDVPTSLYGDYRRSLAGERFLLGPDESWKYFSGVWGGSYEGIEVVEPRLGPFALWQGGEFQDGTLTGRLRMNSSVEYVTLIGRAVMHDNAWRGVGVTLDRRSKLAEGRDRTTESETTIAVAAELSSSVWIPFEWELRGPTSRLRLQEPRSGDVVLEQTLNESAVSSGAIGIAVWGGQVDLEDAVWIPADPRPDAGRKTTEETTAAMDLARVRVQQESFSLPPGWIRYDGDWQRNADGSWHVGPNRGAKLLWEEHPVTDGEIQVELNLRSDNAHIAGLLINVSDPQVGADNWYGYEVSLNADNQTVFVGLHNHGYQMLQQQTVSVRPGEWHSLRAVSAGSRLSVYVDDAKSPAIILDLPNRLTGQLAGIRNWGSNVSFRNFAVATATDRFVAEWPATSVNMQPVRDDNQWSHRQALADLCRTLFNLSEFLYVE
ncbi:MAG: DUF1553 domain-containing protein, partial [Planctomycetaceae bacterium]|nr:DUF1553 domain-containing protein [Planctomycetaceae bacterium]